MTHFLLQLKNAIHERFAGRRTSGNIYINRHNAIATTGDAVAVMIIAAAIGARAHADDPAGFGHLVVNLAQRRGHFVGERAGYDHDVGLPR